MSRILVVVFALIISLEVSAQNLSINSDNDVYMLLEDVKTEIGDKYSDIEYVKKVLKSYKEKNGIIFEIYIALPDGKIVLASDFEMPDDFDPRKYKWYNTDDKYKSETYIDVISGEAIVSYSLNVNNNVKLYVIGIDIKRIVE